MQDFLSIIYYFLAQHDLVMAQIQFSLIKKIKIGRLRHSLTPPPLNLLRPATSLPPNISFLLYDDPTKFFLLKAVVSFGRSIIKYL